MLGGIQMFVRCDEHRNDESWLVVEPTPLKNDGVNVSWDDDIPNIWKNKVNVPNHQPESVFEVF